jgi:threonine dehydratase
MAETARGGWVTRATTSSASTRPSAVPRPTVSTASGRKAAVILSGGNVDTEVYRSVLAPA